MISPLVRVISKDLKLKEDYILLLEKTASFRYKHYTIKKRDGNDRDIYQPSKELKLLQRWLVSNIFCHLPIHENVYSYRAGRNISDMANRLSSAEYQCRIDLQDFFPSIKKEDVFYLLKSSRLDERQLISLSSSDLHFISNIVCRHRALTIGAPSSPMISNCILYDLDISLAERSETEGCIYARYADDIYLGARTKSKIESIYRYATNTIASSQNPRLDINTSKTAFSSRASRKVAVGLTITPQGKVSLGRKRKRMIKTLLFKCISDDATSKQRKYTRGFLNFIISIEPAFYDSLKDKYGAEVVEKIRKNQRINAMKSDEKSKS